MKKTSLQPSFIVTKKKIALMFSMVAGVLMIATTIIVVLLVGYQMSVSAKKVLSQSLEGISLDLQKDSLKEVAINFQSYTSRAGRYSNISEEVLSNDADLAPASEEKSSAFNLAQGLKDSFSDKIVLDEELFSDLKENKQVYSRVILKNGDILFSSDLFETFSIDHTAIGFSKYTVRDVCIYAQTAKVDSGEHEGSTIQVAQYCPFTTIHQRLLMITMSVATVISSLLAYILGYFMAGRFLKPLQESAAHTKAFAQNVYHELFTPVSVAITTVAASLRKSKYKQGLESVNDDLTQIQESLQVLSDSAFKAQAEITREVVDISSIVNEISLECEEHTLELSSVKKNILMQGNKTSIYLLIQNLLSNACKYSKNNSIIIVSLSKKEIIIKNEVEDINKVSIESFFTRYYRGKNSVSTNGKGLGLALVKELATLQGWNVKAEVDENTVVVKVIF